MSIISFWNFYSELRHNRNQSMAVSNYALSNCSRRQLRLEPTRLYIKWSALPNSHRATRHHRVLLINNFAPRYVADNIRRLHSTWYIGRPNRLRLWSSKSADLIAPATKTKTGLSGRWPKCLEKSSRSYSWSQKHLCLKQLTNCILARQLRALAFALTVDCVCKAS